MSHVQEASEAKVQGPYRIDSQGFQGHSILDL